MKIVAIVFPLLLLCRVSRCEETGANKDRAITGTSDALGSLTGAEKHVGVVGGESRGAKDVGVSAEDSEPRQNPGPIPPRILTGPNPSRPFGGKFPSRPPPGSFAPDPFQDSLPQGALPGQFPSRPLPGPPPPGAFPGQFPSRPLTGPPPPGAFPGQFPSRPLTGPPPPGVFPGQFPSRPLTGPPPPGAFPGQFPSRPFPGQRPPRPPPSGSPYPGPFSYSPFGPLPLPATIVNRAISSISEFDDQKCVPRLLCEMASGSTPGVYSGGYYPYRPYRPPSDNEGFLGQEQLLQFLAALTLRNREVSPLAFFGGAALLGISSRGRPEHCYKAFPTCPQDSDGLLEYLNNHRGGFFKAVQPLRMFSAQEGPAPRPPPPLPQRPLSPRPLAYYKNGYQDDAFDSTETEDQAAEVDNSVAATEESEPRIQTHPDRIVGTIHDRLVRPGDWRFPTDYIRLDSDGKKTIFPQNQNVLGSDSSRKGLRKGKKLNEYTSDPPIPINHYPLAIPMLFPDRTGTGDLRLDNSELFGNGEKPSTSTSTRYGRVYFPKDVATNVNRPGEINTRFYVIFPGPAS